MKRRVLIVEDHDDSRKAMRALLESEGYAAFEAKNASESIDRAREFVPDVIVMDLDLPRMSAVNAAARIKSIPSLLHTRIIAITTRTKNEPPDLSRDFIALVRKPMNYSTFLSLLSASIRPKTAISK